MDISKIRVEYYLTFTLPVNAPYDLGEIYQLYRTFDYFPCALITYFIHKPLGSDLVGHYPV